MQAERRDPGDREANGELGRNEAVVARLGLSATAMVLLALLALHVGRYFFLFDDYRLVGLASAESVDGIFSQALIGFYRPFGFLLLSLEHAVFAWRTPAGYALVSLLLHLTNALLLVHLMLTVVPRRPAAAWLSGLIFLLSPWAGEAYFWAGCQFDLLGTFFSLSALSVALRVPSSGSFRSGVVTHLALVSALSACAFLSKESYLVLPLWFLVVAALRDPDRRWVPRRRVALVAALMAATGMAVLALRAQVLPAFEGAYGNYFELLHRARPWALIHAFFLPPFDASFEALYEIARPLFAFLVACVVAVALWTDTRVVALASIALGGTLVPVMIFQIHPNSTSGGRFIYFAGVFFSVVVAHGLLGLRRALGARAGRTADLVQWTIGFALLACMILSVAYQRGLWEESSRIARSSVEQFGRVRGSGTHFHITNLPFVLIEGPYILKSYAFAYYFQDPEIKVRSRRVWLTRDGGGARPIYADRDSFSEYEQAADEVVLTLDYGIAPSGTPR